MSESELVVDDGPRKVIVEDDVVRPRVLLVRDKIMAAHHEQTDVTCVWNATDIEIFVQGRLAARLRVDESKSRSVCIAGPLGVIR